MYAININFGTGRQNAFGLRDEFLRQGGDLRPMDATECVPTGSHWFVKAVHSDRLYYVFAEESRDKPY